MPPEDPGDPTDTTAAVFRTHANYLHAFGTLIRGDPIAGIDHTLQRVAKQVSDAVPRLSTKTPDEAVVRACLNRAWGAELLLAMGRRVAGEDELLRLTNSWAVVQAYYAAYSVTQALIVAEGRARPEAHPATQRQAVDLWVTRRYAVAPWSFAIGSTSHRQTAPDGSINGPVGRPLREVHNWTSCDSSNCWDLAANALRSTRTDAVEHAMMKARGDKLATRLKDWRNEQQQRIVGGKKPRKEPRWPKTANLDPKERATVEARVRHFTLLDYLYRLRVKANYEDATVFTEGPEDEETTDQVARDLELITAATCLAHELRIAYLLGPERLMHFIDSWLVVNGVAARGIGLAARRDLLHRQP